jgi:uncharacterized membrane protein
MNANKPKEGVTVKEIESYAKKHRFEVFFCLAFLLACFFSFVFFSSWSIIFAAVGGIIGVLIPAKVESFSRRAVLFFIKQENTTQLILGVVGLILSIFLPILTFFVLGLGGGRFLQHLAETSQGGH